LLVSSSVIFTSWPGCKYSGFFINKLFIRSTKLFYSNFWVGQKQKFRESNTNRYPSICSASKFATSMWKSFHSAYNLIFWLILYAIVDEKLFNLSSFIFTKPNSFHFSF
jgi:hypothetical protein